MLENYIYKKFLLASMRSINLWWLPLILILILFKLESRQKFLLVETLDKKPSADAAHEKGVGDFRKAGHWGGDGEDYRIFTSRTFVESWPIG